MKNCNEIMEMMPQYIDNELDGNARTEFEKHMANCTECKRELEEIINIVALCGDMSEEELPESFRSDLHKKLLNVKAEEERKSKFVNFFSKYSKLGSSIAAVVLIAILARGLWGGLNFSHSKASTESKSSYDITANSGTKSQAQDQLSQNAVNDSKPSEPAANSVMEAPAAAVQDNAERTMAAKDENTQKAVKQMAKGDSSNVKMKSFTTDSGKSSADTKTAEAQESSTKPSRSGTGDTRYGTAESSPIVNRNIEIAFTVDKIEDTQDKIKTIAAANEAQLQINTEASITAVTYDAGNEVDLNFKVKNEQYDKFISALKSGFDPGVFSAGSLNSVNMDETLVTLGTRLNEVNNLINDIESKRTEGDQETLDKLKAEENDINLQIQNIRRDAGYTMVSLKIVKKQ